MDDNVRVDDGVFVTFLVPIDHEETSTVPSELQG
jgi:hypothetical protein